MSLSLVEGATLSEVPSNDNAKSELHRAIKSLRLELRNRARHLTRDADAANDLVQDAVERALKFSAHYQAGTNVRAWLSQVMFSVFVSKCRRQQRQREVLQLLSHESDGAAFEAPESSTVARQIHAGLGRIPHPFAAVVRLVDLQAYSYREAAETLALPVGTVMSRLHRGRQLLRAELGLAA